MVSTLFCLGRDYWASLDDPPLFSFISDKTKSWHLVVKQNPSNSSQNSSLLDFRVWRDFFCLCSKWWLMSPFAPQMNALHPGLPERWSAFLASSREEEAWQASRSHLSGYCTISLINFPSQIESKWFRYGPAQLELIVVCEQSFSK